MVLVVDLGAVVLVVDLGPDVLVVGLAGGARPGSRCAGGGWGG